MSTDERQQSTTSRPYSFFMASSTDHVTGVTGLSPAVSLSKNGGSFAAASGAVTERGFGWYSIAGHASDRDTLGELLVHATGTGADPFDGKLLVVPWDPYDGAGLGLTRIDAAISSRAIPGDAMDLVTDAVDATALAASAVAEIQSGLATLANQTTILAGLVAINADTDDIQGRLPASLSGGRMRSQVEAIDADAITAASIAASAITSSEAPALANLDAAVSSRASQASVTSLSQGQTAASTTAASGSTSSEVRTPLTQADGFFNGMKVLVINAAGAAVRRIEEYRNTNGAIFLGDALPFTPAVSDVVLVLNDHDPRFGGAG